MNISTVTASSYSNYYMSNNKNAKTGSVFQANMVEASSNITLHYSGTEESGNALTAVGFPDGSSASVYQADDYDPENPEYRVRYWDNTGNYTDTNVKVDSVDPSSASYIEMLAYTSYSDVQGLTKNAYGNFLSAAGGVNGDITYDAANINEKMDFKSMVKEYMQLQYDCNNLAGYLSYKDFYDYMDAGTGADQENVVTQDLGIGFLNVGSSMSYGMRATQVITGESDTTVNVRISMGGEQFQEISVDVSQVNPMNATAVEMFAYCQYADANGTGTDSTWGSWHDLKVVAGLDGTQYTSMESAVSQRTNWTQTLAASQTSARKESTGEELSKEDLLEMLAKTAEEILEKIKNGDTEESYQIGSQSFTKKEWDKVLGSFDSAQEQIHEALNERTEKLQEEYSEYQSENYRIVPDEEAECFRIYDKDGERIGAFSYEDIKIRQDATTGKQLLISEHGTMSYDAVVLDEELKEALQNAMGVEALNVETLQGYTLKRHSGTGIQYLVQDGEEGRGGKVLLQSDADRQRYEELAELYYRKYPNLIETKEEGYTWADFEIKGMAERTEQGILSINTDGISYNDNNKADNSWGIRLSDGMYEILYEWFQKNRNSMEDPSQMSAWQQVLDEMSEAT